MKKISVLVTVLLLLPSLVQGAIFTSYKIVAEIDGGVVHEELLISIFNDGKTELKSASITVPLTTEIFSVRDTYGELSYRTLVDGIKTISFDFTTPIEPHGERLIIVALTADLVAEREGYSEYLLVFTPRQDIPDFEHVLRLPEKTELYSPKETFQMIVPEGEITRELESTTITWRIGLKANDPVVFLVRYKSPSFPWDKVAYGFGATIFIFIGLLVGRRFLEGYRRAKTIRSLKILNERERLVLEEVIKNKGIKQHELQGTLGYTKSSMSKIISKLEARDLIKKVKHGKINRLYPGEKIQSMLFRRHS